MIRYWLPVVLWAGVIFGFSSHPVATTSQFYWRDFIVKKTAHLIEYAVLALLLYRALAGSGMEKKRAGVWAVIISLVYAISDEWHQSFVPGREPKVRDVVIDGLGSGLGVYLSNHQLRLLLTKG